MLVTQTMKQLVKRAKRPTAKDMRHGRVPYEPKKTPSFTIQQMLRMCAYCLNTIEDSEFVEYLAKLRDAVKVTQILEIDGPVSASRVVKQCDEILNETATSINTDIRNDRPTQFRPLPGDQWVPDIPCYDPALPVINSLREVSSQMLAFQASPDTPDGIACSSALNAARQICYWSSLFMTMMDERNVQSPSSVIDHQPPISVSLQFEQNSFPCSTVSSNASCSVSIVLFIITTLVLYIIWTIPNNVFILWSTCSFLILLFAISVFSLPSTSLSHLCAHTSYTIIFPTSFIIFK
ncbi:unnamed protein product [Porites evermanni]|uniref:Uncharacterized protein n=1 Tax=Porites evermanni TaxID=104178 RepID=A0ABN8M2B8_9CNID|nr:unnamed protein product [Porites evermanni]